MILMHRELSSSKQLLGDGCFIFSTVLLGQEDLGLTFTETLGF